MKYFSIRNAVATAAIIAIAASASFAFAATGSATSSETVHPSNKLVAFHGTFSKKVPAFRKGFGGTVTAISGTTITLSGGSKKSPEIYTVDASQAHIMGPKIKVISDIQVGDKLVAIGTINGTTVTAKTIIDRPASLGTPKAFKNHQPAK